MYNDTQIHFFSWATQTALTEEFMFQNAAYRPVVYRTGTFKKFLKSPSSIYNWSVSRILEHKLSKFYGSYGRIIVLSMSNDLQMYTQNAMIW